MHLFGQFAGLRILLCLNNLVQGPVKIQPGNQHCIGHFVNRQISEPEERLLGGMVAGANIYKAVDSVEQWACEFFQESLSLARQTRTSFFLAALKSTGARICRSYEHKSCRVVDATRESTDRDNSRLKRLAKRIECCLWEFK